MTSHDLKLQIHFRKKKNPMFGIYLPKIGGVTIDDVANVFLFDALTFQFPKKDLEATSLLPKKIW